MEDYEIEDDEAEKHAKLLALPPHGSEIFVAGLSSDISENDLRTFCEPVGEVTEVRRMKGTRYAFVEYKSKELAAKAIKQLNKTKLKVRCSRAHTKYRLFIGNVPKSLSEDVLREAVEKMGPGVNQVDLVMVYCRPCLPGYCINYEIFVLKRSGRRNKGFAIVEYYNHACANYSRKKMADPKFKLNSNAPTVIWADPSASQLKAIYVKNLPKSVTKGQLRGLFEHHGEITVVRLPTLKFGQEFRYGFVDFAKRSATMKALRNSERYHLDGQILECFPSKPLTERKGVRGPNTQKGHPLPNCPSQMGMV
ncbi:putative RNA recognition motif domain, nucleotide-binding alpha-beta plait domain superfamily [Dioscorea sansibarensis]